MGCLLNQRLLGMSSERRFGGTVSCVPGAPGAPGAPVTFIGPGMDKWCVGGSIDAGALGLADGRAGAAGSAFLPMSLSKGSEARRRASMRLAGGADGP